MQVPPLPNPPPDFSHGVTTGLPSPCSVHIFFSDTASLPGNWTSLDLSRRMKLELLIWDSLGPIGLFWTLCGNIHVRTQQSRLANTR